MSRLRIYGDQSGYLDLVAPDSASNQVINFDRLIKADSNGNVGIGTESPGSKLEVSGDVSATQVAGARIGFSPQNGGFTFDSTTVADYGLTYTNPQAGGASFNTVVSGFSNIKFTTTRVERMRIVANGNVGIGTSSPDDALHVAGTVRATGITANEEAFVGFSTTSQSIRIVPELGSGAYNPISSAGDAGIIFSTDNVSGTDETGKGLVIAPHTSTSAQGIKIQENGNVGIGTSSPSYMLDVNGTVNATKFVGHDYYSAYASSVITLTNTDAVVPINTQLASSSGSVFTLSAGRVTVTKAGTYMITYDVTTNITSGVGRSDSRALLYKNGSAVTGTESRMYNRTLNAGESTGTATVILTLAANDIIDVRSSQNTGGDTIATLANACRLTIKEV